MGGKADKIREKKRQGERLRQTGGEETDREAGSEINEASYVWLKVQCVGF